MELVAGGLLLFAPLSYALQRLAQLPITPNDSFDVPGNNPLIYCEDPKDYTFEIDHIDVVPNPPKAGTNVSIEASGYLSQQIRENSTVLLEVKIRVGGSSVPFITEEQDLCDLLKSNVGEECPIEKGNITFTRNITLPEEIPKATYLVRADVYDENKDQITCLEATIDF